METRNELKNDCHSNAIFQYAVKIKNYLGKHAKILCYLVIFSGAVVTFTSCVGGYVATEPTYDLNYDRPLPPSESHIWIDGDWRWDNGSRIYIHQPGYWARPRQGRVYEKGYWQSDPRGKTWIRGHWRRDNGKSVRNYNHDRDHDKDKR